DEHDQASTRLLCLVERMLESVLRRLLVVVADDDRLLRLRHALESATNRERGGSRPAPVSVLRLPRMALSPSAAPTAIRSAGWIYWSASGTPSGREPGSPSAGGHTARDRCEHSVFALNKEALMPVGPVDVYIIGFPGNKFSGRIAPAIMELVENGTIRILDLLFVSKDAEGVTTVIQAEDLDADGAGFLEIDVTQPGALHDEDAEEV